MRGASARSRMTVHCLGTLQALCAESPRDLMIVLADNCLTSGLHAVHASTQEARPGVSGTSSQET